METVTLKPFFHNSKECIGIYSPQNATLNHYFQKKAGAKWTKTHKCWYIPCTEANYEQLAKALKGKAILQVDELKKYLLEKRKTNSKEKQHVPITVIPAVKNETQKKPGHVYKSPLVRLNTNNNEQMQKFLQQLQLKAYSPSTMKTYCNEFTQLLQLLGNVDVQQLQPQHLQRYLLWCMKNGLKENTIHSRLNALKFYYEQVLHREKFFFEIPRPKKPLILPKLLNENELRRLFNALTNKKHKAMLFTAYSAGLRVSEIVNLKIKDIDSKRMQIFIERAKGKKDRYVNLSVVLLDILRKYIQTYKPAPKLYLFESEQTGAAYPARTVQQIFTTAKNKAGISKDVGIHSLRHSFATHLLDKGTDIYYIKDLLGHFDIKTTERYLHVSKQKLVNIISPLDDLVKKETLNG